MKPTQVEGSWSLSMRRLVLVATIVLAVAPRPASAQSFFGQLFGFSAPKKAATLPVPSYPQRGGTPLRFPLQSSPRGEPRDGDDLSDGQGGNGTYRTVCVRLCDGFYVPVSFATRRDGFMSDETRCRSTCGGEARLFYFAAKGAGIEQAVDLAGRPYSGLQNAFRYRKALVAGCACHPPPWSDSEKARHTGYARAEASKHSDASVRTSTAQTVGQPDATRAEPPTVAAPAAPERLETTKTATVSEDRPRGAERRRQGPSKAAGLVSATKQQTVQKTASRARSHPAAPAASGGLLSALGFVGL